MSTADSFFEKKPRLVSKSFRIFDHQAKALEAIAKDEKISEADVLREFLEKYVAVYLHRKGTFFCQVCGTLQKNKDKHDIPVNQELLMVGDCCYFNDKYKSVAQQML